MGKVACHIGLSGGNSRRMNNDEFFKEGSPEASWLAEVTAECQSKASQPRYSIGQPISALAPIGACVFTEEWSSSALLQVAIISHDTKVFTFGLPEQRPLGLSTCACILAMGGADADGNPVVRPYTPVSTNAMCGKFELMVKIYEQGVLSQHMDKMAIGDTLQFKHIPFNVKIQAPFGKRHIGMLWRHRHHAY